MIFALTEIAISSIWYISKFTLWGIYKILYFMYYGSQPDPEELHQEELEHRIKDLEEKLSNIEKDSQNESLNIKKDEKNE